MQCDNTCAVKEEKKERNQTKPDTTDKLRHFMKTAPFRGQIFIKKYEDKTLKLQW